MSLRDDLASITMDQTRDYREQSPQSGNSSYQTEPSSNDGSSTEEGNSRRSPANPFKGENGEGGALSALLGNKKFLLIGLGGLLVAGAIVAFATMGGESEDQGADFLTEMEQQVSTFQYTVEERETLRNNGYTADDIERFQAEEADPYLKVQEAEQARKAKLEEEMKPILDGASPAYKKLEAMTWLGGTTMSQEVLNNAEGSYEERYGTYNVDYTKVEARGAQLFVKLILKEFNNQPIFMTMTATRYNELDQTGNIVVVIEYNKYADGSILVTNVQEKDIVG